MEIDCCTKAKFMKLVNYRRWIDFVGKLIAVERPKLLSSVNINDTKELWSSIGHSGLNINVVKSVFDLCPPLDDINAMNQCFADVATDPAYDLKQILSNAKLDDDQCEYYFSKFEVYHALQSVHRTHALPYWLFKNCALELADIITYLCNKSLATTAPPESRKFSIVTPTPKVNPPSTYSDLRPVSVTPILSRIFEKVFVREVSLPATPKRLINDQFAFRPTGTTAALLNLFHNVTGMLEIDDHVGCFFIDFSKAFETVSHSVLLDMIVAYNCPQLIG
jgi:Reverse transcriptase (RNA-dependent DNA polymerase)